MIRGMLILQISHFLGRILFLIFSLWYLNRYLGVAAKGTWSGFYALMSILGVMANMGFEVWLTRSVAKEALGAKQAIRLLFKLKGVSWAVALLLGALFVIQGGHPWSLAIPFGIALVLDGVGVAQQAVFEGLSNARAMAVMSFIKSGGFVVLVTLAVVFLGHQTLVFFAWVFAAALGLRVIYARGVWNYLPPDKNYPGSYWRECLLMGAWTLATVLYFSVDGVMLLQMVGPEATGIYSNAYHFVEGSLFISAAMGSMLYPRLIQAAPNRRGDLFDLAFGFMLTVACMGVVALHLVGPFLGEILAGPVFEESKQALFILAWCLPIMFGNGLLGRWLLAEHRERFALITALIGASFNIIGNLFAIPRWGVQGAAAMTLLTEGGLFLVWILWGRQSWELLLRLLGLILLTAVLLFATQHLPHPGLGLLLGLCVFLPLGLYQAFRLEKRAAEP